MNYLAIDTSGKNLTIIIKKGDEVFKYSDPDCGVQHSVELMPRVEELIDKAKFDLKSADFFACVVGAGSFTGIRIGVATIKAMCFAYSKSCLAITSFDTLAYNEKGGKVLALIDAKHNGFYACGYDNGKVVLAIGEFAFRDNTVITKVTLPKTLTSIEKFAFDGCTSIKSIIIPDNVTKIGSYAFSDCNSLEEIVLPFVGNSSTGEGATSNYDKNFGFIFGSGSNSYVPESLKKATVTKGRVAAGSFRGCSSLETIILPDGLQEIGDRTFQSCTSLKNIIIPESVKTIGEFAFADCKSLIEIDIPKSITLLQRCSFYGCRNLITINYNDDKDAWKVIQKEDSWDDLVPFNGCSYMIVCTNGIIEVNN